MAAIPIVLALGDYEHTRDLMQGVVRAEGIEINYLKLPIEEITFRFLKFREWEASELSFAKYVALRSQGDDSIIALPVFPSRMFRLSSIYVRRDGKVRTLAELRRGARIGVPEWAQTAAIYTRGYIEHELGMFRKIVGPLKSTVKLKPVRLRAVLPLGSVHSTVQL